LCADVQGEVFGIYSSFNNGDAFRFAPPGFSPSKPSNLENLEREYAKQQDQRKKIEVDDGKLRRYEPFYGQQETKWHGIRKHSDEQYSCNGKPYPGEKNPVLDGMAMPKVMPSRTLRAGVTIVTRKSLPDPEEYGGLRLYKSPTETQLRKIQARIEEEKEVWKSRRYQAL
jgi:hypothetical protein